MLTVRPDGVPFLTTDRMREVDRAMVEDYRVLLIQMMENAGRSLARLARERFLGGDPVGKRIVILAGPGGNGGGGLVCARRLHGWGSLVAVYLSREVGFSGVPAHQLDVIKRPALPVTVADEIASLPDAELIVDGLIGYGLRGAPRGVAAALIRAANAHGAPIPALDAPSGLDTTAGTISDPTIRATAALTLALPKVGPRVSAAQVGELYLADIGVPPELYAGPDVGPIFARNDPIRLW